ncbi:terminase small subunit protein [Phyllobacterium sp. 22552]|uniref:terminase small subunit-like protein n=1 Tax=Phyllobacterium sp. 22552 TaxID=3453941 RepID=UPI003F82ACCC
MMSSDDKISGRPSIYSDELVANICVALASGRSLRDVCTDKGMPAASTVFLWLSKHPGFSEQYARAMEARTNALAEEILEIADDSAGDVGITADGREVVKSDVIARARLRVDTRKWLMSKMAPKKYGDKISQEVSGPDGKPVETVTRIERIIVKSADRNESSET